MEVQLYLGPACVDNPVILTLTPLLFPVPHSIKLGNTSNIVILKLMSSTNINVLTRRALVVKKNSSVSLALQLNYKDIVCKQ